MPKQSHDYDSVFKTMKTKHKRLFISVINETFGKCYPTDVPVEALPAQGYLTESETGDGSTEIEEKVSDFLIKIGGEVYLLECQSYDDGSMAIRMAEYAFIAARQAATWDIGHATIPMPHFSAIYVKRTEKTPKTTSLTFTFPDGQTVNYQTDNIILAEFTKEEIVEKRLFPYIPFYIARYEKDIASAYGDRHVYEKDIAYGDRHTKKETANSGSSERGVELAAKDLEYFKAQMLRLHDAGELRDDELMGLVNTIITHITNGNGYEERLVKIMGGTVLETESERLIRIGKEQGMEAGKKYGIISSIELILSFGLDEEAAIAKVAAKYEMPVEQVRLVWESH